jgi:SpoVK/Ycf46/Vps4 family AAA+-type ATPase
MSVSSHFTEYYKRFFFIYGKTDDEFCLLPYGMLRLEEALFHHLKSLGYQRILFFNGKQKLFFYDHESKRLSRLKKDAPQPPIAQGKSKICQGPLGMRKVKRQAETQPQQAVADNPDSETPLNFGRMTDLDMIGMMCHCMKDETVKTAVVFTDGLDFINHTDRDAVRQMGLTLKEWSGLFAHNQNACLFILPEMDLNSMRQLLNRNPQWTFLETKLFDKDKASGQTICVGSPRKNEVLALLHYFRLARGLPADCRALSDAAMRLTRELCSKGDNLKKLTYNLLKLKDLNASTLRALTQNAQERPALERLKSMRGLEAVARRIEQFVALQQENDQEEEAAAVRKPLSFDIERLSPPPQRRKRRQNLHLALLGAPGTGKTTAAGMIGEIFRETGLLELGHLVKVTRKDLVAGYVGQTAIKTAEKINQAMGGVLFVDEAYTLAEGGDNDFGKEAIDTILEAMSDRMGDFSVIVAGYPEKINNFIHANEGLKSRFGDQNTIAIPDYSPETLCYIFEQEVAHIKRTINPSFKAKLPEFFVNWQASEDPKTFGNARAVVGLVQRFDTLRRQRVVRDNPPQSERFTFTEADMPGDLKKFLGSNKSTSLESLYNELDSLIGLTNVKSLIKTMMNRLKVERLRGGSVAPGHYLFVGNPGTGKTTVARLIGKMLYCLGLLKKGHLKETGRPDLVAGYSGQTAIKTREILEESLDGVLFIDEAYQLVQSDRDDFGKEALETLVAFMENHRDRLCIIAAGYPEPMRRFVNSNPGLPSRFSGEIMFDNYSGQEMLAIFQRMATGANMTLEQGLDQSLAELFEKMSRQAGPTFGNGREVRNYLNSMIDRQANRLATRSLAEKDPELYLLKREDM